MQKLNIETNKVCKMANNNFHYFFK